MVVAGWSTLQRQESPELEGRNSLTKRGGDSVLWDVVLACALRKILRILRNAHKFKNDAI